MRRRPSDQQEIINLVTSNELAWRPSQRPRQQQGQEEQEIQESYQELQVAWA